MDVLDTFQAGSSILDIPNRLSCSRVELSSEYQMEAKCALVCRFMGFPIVVAIIGRELQL